MDDMRILFVIDSLSGRGAEKLMNDMLPILNGGGRVCELLILTDEGQKYLDNLTQQGIKVAVVPPECGSHIKRIRFIKKHIISGKYDIVHANLFPVIYYCALAKIISGKRFPHLAMTEHNSDNRRRHHKILRPLEKIIYGKYEKVISISEPVRRELMNWLKISKSGRKTDKFVVVHNGIPLRQFENAKGYRKEELFPKIGENDVLLCMTGSFTEQKNHMGMLKIMTQLPERYKLLLVGEGELFEAVKKEAEHLRLNDRAVFLGFRKDIAEITKTVDIVVIPSKWEGFGLVAVEAMVCGKPIVASNVCGLAEVVGNAGITADCSDPGKFARAILRLEDENLYAKCKKNAEKRAELFSIEKMCDGYGKIFETMAES